ncbi:MAG: peptidylprolyl isomerase [Bacteroidetes bacterium]|nr:peptidylprolyl isomerase [Bacteroidota bacterium]
MNTKAISFLTLAVFVLGSTAIVAQSNKDAVLMTVGDSKVTVAEFENVYKKNSGKESATEKKSLDNYIELFTNFKLKVKEAEEMKLDTSAAFKNELSGYRKQLAQPYLTDKDVNEKLLKEAYERMQTEIRASHILIKCAENALPKDTLAAFTKIMSLHDQLLGKKGAAKADFGVLAKANSEDPSAKDNDGDLGYFTALQMVYPFENVAYATKVGEISIPVRTKFGYHLIKVADRRPAQGEILVAHIMIKTPKDMTKEDSINGVKKIEEIYQKVKAGENFSELAKQFSDDKASGTKGGELPWFGTNRMPAEFEKESFALKNNGDFSGIFRTRFGWHIIKRIDKRGVAAFDDMKGDLKSKVTRDSRSQMGRTSMIAKIKSECKFKDNVKLRDEFYPVIDTNFFNGTWKSEKAAKLNKVMFALNDMKYTQTDFARYLESHQSRRAKSDVKPAIDAMYKQFVDETCIAYEESRLDQKFPEFRALMQEYRDGILLFDLTDKKVWSKAVKDTLGLKEFYEKNKQNYLWEQRAEASIYTCADEKVANEVKAMLKKNKTQKEILDVVNKKSQLNLQVESKLFLPKENSFVDANWNPGISANKKENGKIMFVEVKKLLKPEPKAFNESKGLVTADYQNYLEKEWIESLKKKYPVTVNKEVLSTIQ